MEQMILQDICKIYDCPHTTAKDDSLEAPPTSPDGRLPIQRSIFKLPLKGELRELNSYLSYKLNINIFLHLFVFIVLGCTLASCANTSNGTIATKLAQAEAIMYAAPDSALQLLENLQPPKGKEQRATWALLLAHARYKNNIRQSDSLVNTAYSYFEKTDDAERKTLALYLNGGIAGENGEMEEAQKYYLQAKDEVEKTEDYQLGYLIHEHVGNMYIFRNLKEQALQFNEKAFYYANRTDNKAYKVSSLINLARTYNMEPKDVEKAITYYKKALSLAEAFQNRNKQKTVIWELVHIYGMNNDFEQALNLARKGLQLQEEDGKIPNNAYLVLGIVFKNMGQQDSATYYLEKATISTDNIRTKGDAFRLLYELDKDNKRYANALAHCEQYLSCLDSVLNRDSRNELAAMQAKYDQQKVINERNQLQMDKDRLIRQALIAVVALIALIALITITYQRALFRKEHALKKQEESARQNALKLAENERIISRNNQRMAELAQQIKEGENYKDQLEEQTATLVCMQEQNKQLAIENKKLQDSIHRQTVHRQSEEVNELNRLTTENRCLHERETTLTALLVGQNAFLDRIKTKHDYLKDEQWPLFKEELDRIFDGYTQRLVKAAPTISESELRLACLIKLKMSNGEMADVLGISPSSVGKAKLRLKDRLAHAVASFDKSMMLDVWLWEF